MCAILLAALFLPLLQDQPRAVSGTVTDASGSTIPGAVLQLEAAGVAVSSTVTGTDGRFTFITAAPDPLRLVVSAPGFAQRLVSVAVDANLPLTIELGPAPFFEAVQVTSSRGTEPRSDPTVAATVFPAADVTTSAALGVDDVLKSVPGFTLFPSSRVANPTTQTMMLRGLGGSGVSRSLVLADGVPLNDPFGAWVYWDKVPHAAIERIEVLRGGGSDLYGADAVGGVVQILTLEPSDPTARVLLEGGNLATGRVSAFGGGRRGAWTLAAGGQWFTTEGYVLVAPEERGDIERPAGSRHRSAMASVNVTTRKNWRIGARLNVFSEDRKNGTVLQVNDTSSRLLSGDAIGGAGKGFLAIHLFGLTQRYDQSFSAIEAEPPRSGEYLHLVQRVPTTSVGGSIRWSRQIGQANLLVGGETRRIDGDALNTWYSNGRAHGPQSPGAGGSQRLASGFVRTAIAVHARLTLTASAHADAWHSASTTFEQTVGSFSPRIAAAYRLGESGVSLRGAAFGGFRAPTLNELHRSFQVGNDVTLPNERLRPEKLRSAEAGLNVRRGIVAVRATAFFSVLDDAVTNVTVSTLSLIHI